MHDLYTPLGLELYSLPGADNEAIGISPEKPSNTSSKICLFHVPRSITDFPATCRICPAPRVAGNSNEDSRSVYWGKRLDR